MKTKHILPIILLGTLIAACSPQQPGNETEPTGNQSTTVTQNPTPTPEPTNSSSTTGNASTDVDFKTVQEVTREQETFFGVDPDDIIVPKELIDEFGEEAIQLPRQALSAILEGTLNEVLITPTEETELQDIVVDEYTNVWLTGNMYEQVSKDLENLRVPGRDKKTVFNSWLRLTGTLITVPSEGISLGDEKLKLEVGKLWTRYINDVKVYYSHETGKATVKLDMVTYAPLENKSEEYTPIISATYEYEMLLVGKQWKINNVKVNR